MPDKTKLDPFDILTSLAESCDRTQDAAFWILISAAWHLKTDSHKSVKLSELGTVAHYFPEESRNAR